MLALLSMALLSACTAMSDSMAQHIDYMDHFKVMGHAGDYNYGIPNTVTIRNESDSYCLAKIIWPNGDIERVEFYPQRGLVWNKDNTGMDFTYRCDSDSSVFDEDI